MSASVVVLSGSTRVGSHNTAVAVEIARSLSERGVGAELVDLRAFTLPLFDPDLEAADGVPDAARRLHDVIGAHDGLVIVTPEYNGSVSTLLKNTIDWIARVDRSVLQRRVVALASASPSSRGGATGRASLRAMCDHMGVELLERELGVARSHEVVVDGVIDDEHASAEIDAFAAAVVEALGGALRERGWFRRRARRSHRWRTWCARERGRLRRSPRRWRSAAGAPPGR